MEHVSIRFEKRIYVNLNSPLSNNVLKASFFLIGNKHRKIVNVRFSLNALNLFSDSASQQLMVSSLSEKATIAETLWACKVAESKYSLASCEGIEKVRQTFFI